MIGATVVVTDVDWAGDSLAAPTAAGDLTLLVDQVVDFDEDGGGWLIVGASAPMRYVSADEDASTVTLAAAVGAIYEQDTPVYTYDPTAPTDEKRSLTHYAVVQKHDGDLPFRALITDERTITAGVDKLHGASVGLEPMDEDEDSWRVAVVYGRETALDLSTADPETAPPGLGGSAGAGQTFLDRDPEPADAEGLPENHGWWVVDTLTPTPPAVSKVLRFFRLVGGAWAEQEIVSGEAAYFQNALIEALQVTGLTAVSIDGGSIYIAQGTADSMDESFTGTSLPAGWTSTKTRYDGSTLVAPEGSAVPGVSVVTSGPSGQVGSALLVDMGAAGGTTNAHDAGGAVVTALPVTANGEVRVRFWVADDSYLTSEDCWIALRSTGTPLSTGWNAVVLNLIPETVLGDGRATFRVDRIINGSRFALTSLTAPFAVGSWSMAHLRVQAETVYAKVWPDGGTEPAYTVAPPATLPQSPGRVEVVWRQYLVGTFAPSAGQAVWLDSLAASSFATGFQVTPDGIMTSPATGIGIGDQTWRTVGAVGEPAFQNGWSTLSGDAVQFRKSATGDVALVGRAVPGATGAAVFTLPDDYRPSRDLTDIIVKAQGGVGITGTMDILANGQVTLRQYGTSTWVSLTWAFPAN